MALFTDPPAKYPEGWAPAPVVAAMAAAGWYGPDYQGTDEDVRDLLGAEDDDE